jgi:K+-sensing histidine kinase KdpD
VLANLVSNAIKFSPLGSRIEMRAASEKNGLRIEICGQGQGFPPELFLTDCSANFSTTGTAGEVGCGLGLNIVSLYVGKIGGVLELRNSENGGGAASILLPVD